MTDSALSGVLQTIATVVATWPACWKSVMREIATSTSLMPPQKMMCIGTNNNSCSNSKAKMVKVLALSTFYNESFSLWIRILNTTPSWNAPRPSVAKIVLIAPVPGMILKSSILSTVFFWRPNSCQSELTKGNLVGSSHSDSGVPHIVALASLTSNLSQYRRTIRTSDVCDHRRR